MTEQTNQFQTIINQQNQFLTNNISLDIPEDIAKKTDIDAQTAELKPDLEALKTGVGTPLDDGQLSLLGGMAILLGGATVVGSIASVKAVAVANGVQLTTVLARLGPQLVGGISGFLKKLWDFLQVDRILSILTYATTIHNAYFLSRDIGETLFAGFNSILNVFGLKNADGSDIDIGAVVGKWTEAFAKKLLGVETLAKIKEEWKKLSRIYHAAYQVLQSVQSLIDSLRTMVEIMGENISKIGNALKRSGAVLEDSFGWMQERWGKLSIGFGRWEKAFTTLESIENVAGSFEQITGEAVSIKDNIKQLKEERAELRRAIQEYGYLNTSSVSDRGTTAESVFIRTEEHSDKTESQAPEMLTDSQIGFPEEVE